MDVSAAASARQLASELSRLAGLAAEVADAAVFEATRERGSAKAVAEALGVSEAAVRKAIRQHNARRNAR